MHRLKSLCSADIIRKVEYSGRIMPPKRGEQDQVYASVSAVKLQLFDEFIPGKLEYCHRIADPFSGGGGFMQYCAYKFRNRGDVIYYYSTLQYPGHHTTAVNLMGNTKMNIVDVRPKSSDGDMRQQRMINVYQQADRYDFMIIDAGEGRDPTAYRRWLFMNRRAGKSIAHSIEQLMECINEGGHLLLRIVGVHPTVNHFLCQICTNFRQVDCFRSPTTPNYSAEWYCFFSLKDGNKAACIQPEQLGLVLGTVAYELESIFYETKQLLKHPFRASPPITRRDWFAFDQQQSSVIDAKVFLNDKNSIFNAKNALKLRGGEIVFKVRGTERLRKIKEEVKFMHGRKLVIADIHRPWKHLYGVGTLLGRKIGYETEKTCQNWLISDYCFKVLGQELAINEYGFTQGRKDFIEQSYNRRFDVNPGSMDKGYLDVLIKAYDHVLTRRGASMLGKCGFLSKEQTLSMLNKQGATDIFSRQGSIGQFIEAHPDWYEMAFALRIHKWEADEPTAARQVIRYKKESKLRKDLHEDGRLTAPMGTSRDDLLQSSYMVPRQIQFSDELTRIAHVIMCGDLLQKHQQGKLYKGSVNGTPAHIQGRIVRALFGLNSKRHPIPEHAITAMDMHVNYNKSSNNLITEDGEIAVICIDFSAFDCTQTIIERMNEADFVARFFPDCHRRAIINMMAELGYPIIFNDYGDVVMREGQRGSGELFTSFLNTLLAICHVASSISIALNIPIEKILKKVGTLTYKYQASPLVTDSDEYIVDIESFFAEDVKELEIIGINILADGDDIYIVVDEKQVPILTARLEETLALGCKVIRSGSNAGFSVVHQPSKVTYCSHTYEHVVVSDKLPQSYLTEQDAFDFLYTHPTAKLFYLPTRTDDQIMGKMPNTLKQITREFSIDNERALEITRGKILSYLLLYPHSRVVRTAALCMLAAVPGKNVEWQKKNTNRTAKLAVTITGALFSLYGVDSLDKISMRNYREEISELKVLRHNARLLRHNCPVRIADFINSSIDWLIDFSSTSPVDYDIIQVDSKLYTKLKM